MPTSVIEPKDLEQRLARSDRPRIIDVREPDEFARGHLPGAVCVPAGLLDSVAAQWPADAETVVVCWSGQRAGAAAERLRSMGLRRVDVLEGGTRAWQSAGLPVARERAGIPLMRQVLMAMGLIFAALFVGSLWWAPLAWAGIALGGFAVFAGASGICPMSAVLSRMPWNRRRPQAKGECAASCCGS